MLISPGLVVGICAAAAVVLAVYLLRDHGSATLRLETEPRDARVSIDGHTASGMSSPFVFSELAAGVNHDIRVEKSGYTTWSIRLRLRRDKTLDLPVVKLESLQPAPLADPTPPSAVLDSPPPPAAEPAPVAQAQPRNDAVRSKRPVATTKRTPAAPSARPVVAAPAAGGAKGKGTLRVNTRPWSQVSIDGKLIGNTPQMNLQLQAGTHTVVLSNPEFGVTKSLVVTIKPDETVTRVITLAP
jgi:serine/threonine-protein kinase